MAEQHNHSGISKPKIETEKHKKMFEVWYLNKRNITLTARQLGVSHMPIRRYSEWFDWDKKANQRDIELGVKATNDEIIVDKCIEVVERHKEISKALLGIGMKFLEENGVETARDALAAIKLGMEMERKSFDLPDYVKEITSKTDQELVRRARELMTMIGDAAEQYNTPEVQDALNRQETIFTVAPEDVKVLPENAETR